MGLYVCLVLIMVFFIVTFPEYVFYLNSHFLDVEIHFLSLENAGSFWNTEDF